MKLAINITFLHLLVVATSGMFMRTLPFVQVEGISFDHLRHAHSHLAFLGWVFPAFFLAFVQWFLPPGSFETPRYRPLFWGSQAIAAGMFVAFLVGGYGAISIALLTGHTLLAWIFIAYFLKDLAKIDRVTASHLVKRQASAWFAVAALAAFFISSLGPFAIPVIQIAGGGNPLWMKMAVGFYLHFQTSGWFVLGLLALFFRGLEIAEVAFSGKLARWLLAVLVLSLVPTFFANLTFYEFSPAAMWAIRAAAIIQWAMLSVFLLHVFQKNRLAPLFSNRLSSIFLTISLLSLWLKMACKALVLLQGMEQVFDLDNHFLMLGYLHLLFLGSVTTLLFAFFSTENPTAWSGRLAGAGGWLFLIGFFGSETLLFFAGLGFMLPDLATGLMFFSGCLLAGIGILTERTCRQTPPDNCRDWQTTLRRTGVQRQITQCTKFISCNIKQSSNPSESRSSSTLK